MQVTKQHAQLSASSAHRWCHCAASVLLSQGVPDTPSKFAEEGTRAHHYAELWLNRHVGKLTPEQAYELRDFLSDPENDEMRKAIAKYVDVVLNQLGGSKAKAVFVEKRLGITDLTGEANAYGTADCVLITEQGELWIVDLKYGKGVDVSAEENEQLMLYGFSAYDLLSLVYDIRSINLAIVQPRLESVSTWEMPRWRWELYRGMFKNMAARARLLLKEGEQPGSDIMDYAPSAERCRFCKGKLKCKAITDMIHYEIIKEFEVLPVENSKPRLVTGKVVRVPDNDYDLAWCFKQLPVIKSWCDAVEEEAFKRAMKGVKLDGLKLVEGRPGVRKWTDEKAVALDLKRMVRKAGDRTKTTIISPTDAEKLYKNHVLGKKQWEKLQTYVTRSQPAPKLVEASDKRPAINVDSIGFEAISA